MQKCNQVKTFSIGSIYSNWVPTKSYRQIPKTDFLVNQDP